MSVNKETTSEEIDLGQLFKLIGDTLNKLFLFIKNIFNGIFHSAILFLQFIQKHFLKFVIAGILGVGIGWFLDSGKPTVYRSSMIVEPNFKSTQQLYNNIEFYDKLAAEAEYDNLANALKISSSEAETIKRVVIESFTDENQKLKQFSDFVATLDSTSRENLSYKDYLENFNNINARFHKITIESEDPKVAKKSQNEIVRAIANNSYFQLQKTTNDLNLKIDDSIINRQLKELDSLKLFYQKLKLLEANKENGNSETSINLAGDKESLDNSEIVLLSRAKDLNNEILSNNNKRANTKNIINVISDFPNRGAMVNEWFRQSKFTLPILFIGITFIVLVLLSINTFLKGYSKNN